jgi:2-polyprenyl-3-methyl-5-hydroxy-6-metoxy-1,4-benzoquinol methylase
MSVPPLPPIRCQPPNGSSKHATGGTQNGLPGRSEDLPFEVWLQSNAILRRIFPSKKFVRLRVLLESKSSPRILDIGSGGHSPTLTMSYFPDARYVGVDRSSDDYFPEDMRLMETFVEVDLESAPLTEIPDRAFDLVIVTHVLEHLERGENLLRVVARKIAVGGYIYISYPTPASVDFPRIGQNHKAEL